VGSIVTRKWAARLAFFLLLIAGSHPAISAPPAPLVFGVFPHLPARQMVEAYRPLAYELEKQLHRRVVIYSARDYQTFATRTRLGTYDIILTAPHLAWLARQEAGYRPLLKYAQPVHGLLVVKADSVFDSAKALRGRIIATSDPTALAVMAIQAEMSRQGIQADTDYRTVESGTHLNAVMQVLNGRAEGAMLGMHAYMLMPPNVRQQLRVLIETPPLSSLMYLTHPRLRDAEVLFIHKAMLRFEASSEGQAFMQHGGYGGFSNTDSSELHAFRPYALQAQKMLQNTR
jgi:phosphonate transport system substrate-binding protein